MTKNFKEFDKNSSDEDSSSSIFDDSSDEDDVDIADNNG